MLTSSNDQKVKRFTLCIQRFALEKAKSLFNSYVEINKQQASKCGHTEMVEIGCQVCALAYLNTDAIFLLASCVYASK